MFVCLVWRNSTGIRKKAIFICFCCAHEQGKLKRLVYSYVQTDVTEIVIWNTKIFKEILSFLFFLSLCFQTQDSIAISMSAILIFFFAFLVACMFEDRITRGTIRAVDMTYTLDRAKKPLQLSVRITCSHSSCGQPDISQLILSRRLKRFAGINAADLTMLLLQERITNDNIQERQWAKLNEVNWQINAPGDLNSSI